MSLALQSHDSLSAPSSAGDAALRDLSKIALPTTFALLVANIVFLAASTVQGYWPVDHAGQPIFSDFVNVWAAGQLVLDGHPTAAYDWTLHKAAQEAALHRPLVDFFFWFYPPPFLAVAAGLGLLPYVPAFILWLGTTFAAYLIAVRSIVGHRVGLMLAAAFPAIISNAMVGQNGYLTAALLGGMLHLLPRRPAVAGVLLGLLSYKPHFGILIPLALICGGYWRTIVSATATSLALGALCTLAFGLAAWRVFLESLPVAQGVLAEGVTLWHKLHSFYAVVRVYGGTDSLGWAVQGCVIAICIVGIAALWRSRLMFELKAAGLAVGALLVTPYLFVYDLVVLAVPMAFLIRIGMTRGFLHGEMLGLVATSILLLLFPLVDAPLGLTAIVVVALLVGRRAVHDAMRMTENPLAGLPRLADGREGQAVQ